MSGKEFKELEAHQSTSAQGIQQTGWCLPGETGPAGSPLLSQGTRKVLPRIGFLSLETSVPKVEDMHRKTTGGYVYDKEQKRV